MCRYNNFNASLQISLTMKHQPVFYIKEVLVQATWKHPRLLGVSLSLLIVFNRSKRASTKFRKDFFNSLILLGGVNGMSFKKRQTRVW